MSPAPQKIETEEKVCGENGYFQEYSALSYGKGGELCLSSICPPNFLWVCWKKAKTPQSPPNVGGGEVSAGESTCPAPSGPGGLSAS